MDEIAALARERDLLLVEDAAQAHGARNGTGQAGTLGDVGCFSFFPSKNLGCCGDGGLVATNSEEIANRVEMIHDHGRTGGRHHAVAGLCSRLDTIQAAILRVKLPHLDRWNERRRTLARRYKALLDGCPDLRLPPYDEGAVFHHYAVRTSRRDELKEQLGNKGIASGIHYPHAIPEEPAYARYRTVPTPVSERSCREVLSLPLFPEMRDQEVETVVKEVRAFLEA